MRQTKFQKAVYWSRKITPILNKNIEKGAYVYGTSEEFKNLFIKTKYTYLYNFLATFN